MTTLRYAMLSALLSPSTRDHTPTAAARDWLQTQTNEAGLIDDFRLFDESARGRSATVEVEVKQHDEWREALISLEFAQGAWAVTEFEWID